MSLMMIELFFLVCIISFGVTFAYKWKKTSGPRPQRNTFFSDAHPELYDRASSMLPKLHGYVIGFVLLYLVLAELVRGNYMFMLDWYHKSWILPAIVQVTSSKEAFESWFQQDGSMFILSVLIIILALWTIYNMLWRTIFPDYYREIYKDWTSRQVLTEMREGRLYWSTDNRWTRLWDRWYGSPPRMKHYIWIHQHRWPPLNPLNPVSSMTRIELSFDEWLEARGPKKIVGHEKPIRMRVGLHQLATTDRQYATAEIPLKKVIGEFDDRTRRLITETRELSKGNAAIRLEKLKNVEIAEEEFLGTMEEAQQRGKGVQGKSGQ